MARSMYQYETSPRKIQPDYTPRHRDTRKKDNKKSEEEQLKELEEKKTKTKSIKIRKKKTS